MKCSNEKCTRHILPCTTVFYDRARRAYCSERCVVYRGGPRVVYNHAPNLFRRDKKIA